MASLTPAALVAQLEDWMRSGSVLPVGRPVGIEEWLPPLAAGIAPSAAPDLVCVMVGAPGVENTYQGIDGLFAGWRDWGESFERLDLIVEDVVEVPVGALIRVQQRAVTRHDAVAVEQRSAMLLRLRDGRIGAVEFHLDRATAERASAG